MSDIIDSITFSWCLRFSTSIKLTVIISPDLGQILVNFTELKSRKIKIKKSEEENNGEKYLE